MKAHTRKFALLNTKGPSFNQPYLPHKNTYGSYFLELPSSPRDLKVTDVTEDTVGLEWSPPDNLGGTDLLGYVIEKRDASRTQWVKVGQAKPELNRYNVRNLLEGRDYVFRIFAENTEGLSEPTTLLSPVMPQRPVGKEYCSVDPQTYFILFYLDLL